MIDLMPMITAFLAGLFGGVHCVVMCGGVVSLLTPAALTQNRRQQFFILLGYNFGRIFSYALAGAIMGGVGALLVHWLPLQITTQILTAIAALFMLLLGLYLTDWWRGLVFFERLGQYLWRLIEPTARQLLPIKNINQALFAGFLWGWLPCGLVYSILATAVATASIFKGAFIMLAFGLGTLPALLSMGFFIGGLAHLAKARWLKISAGLIMIGFAFITFLRIMMPMMDHAKM